MAVYIVYGVTDCPACLRACALLMELDKEYVFMEMDFSKSYRKQLKENHSWNTFPLIIKSDKLGEELVGGYEELLEVLEKEDDILTYEELLEVLEKEDDILTLIK